jgi:hypothetical protein
MYEKNVTLHHKTLPAASLRENLSYILDLTSAGSVIDLFAL